VAYHVISTGTYWDFERAYCFLLRVPRNDSLLNITSYRPTKRLRFVRQGLNYAILFQNYVVSVEE
jgi:hypothetical protein